MDDGVRFEEVTEIPGSWRVYPPYGDSGGGVLGENPTISVIELYVTPFDWLGAWHDKEKSQQSDLAAGRSLVSLSLSMIEMVSIVYRGPPKL